MTRAAFHVLLLAGTAQARRLAENLGNIKGLRVTASLAGATRQPRPLATDTRIGGFGGVEGFAAFLGQAKIDLVLDATHPFAARMTQTAQQVSAAKALPHAILQRPAWQPGQGDTWHFVAQLAQAAALIPNQATVFLGTGRQSLAELANLAPRRVLARVIDAPTTPFPFVGGRFVQGKPPFTPAQEIRFFKRESIDWLVVKNSGGDESRAKLIAARQLGLPVVMQSRPSLPDARLFEREAQAAAWIRSHL